MLDFKYEYEQLKQNKSIDDITLFINQAEKFGEYRYYFKANILLADIFINKNAFIDAESILSKCLDRGKIKVFPKAFVAVLSRLIFIHLEWKNFTVAYKYAHLKRLYINDEDIEEISRWNLEMATIYAELNQKTKAIANLETVINITENKDYFIVALSNLTKLYLDQKMIDEAKKTLNLTLDLVLSSEDKKYITYLFAKLMVLENNNQEAEKYFSEAIGDFSNIENIEIALDYLEFLIETKNIDKANELNAQLGLVIYKGDDLEAKRFLAFLRVQLSALSTENAELRLATIQLKLRDEELKLKRDLNVLNTIEEERKTFFLEQARFENDSLHRLERKLSNIFSSRISFKDVINSFGNALKLENINVEFMLLFSRTFFPFTISGKVYSYYYKDGKLYEKALLKGNVDKSNFEKITKSSEIIFKKNATNLFFLKPLEEDEKYLIRKTNTEDFEFYFLIKDLDNFSDFKKGTVSLCFLMLEIFISKFLIKNASLINEKLVVSSKYNYLIFDEYIYLSDAFSAFIGKEKLLLQNDYIKENSLNKDFNFLETTLDVKYNLKSFIEVRKSILSDFRPLFISEIKEKQKKVFDKDNFFSEINGEKIILAYNKNHHLKNNDLIYNIYSEGDASFTCLDSVFLPRLKNEEKVLIINYPKQIADKFILVKTAKKLLSKKIYKYSKEEVLKILKDEAQNA